MLGGFSRHGSPGSGTAGQDGARGSSSRVLGSGTGATVAETGAAEDTSRRPPGSRGSRWRIAARVAVAAAIVVVRAGTFT